jgi:hypothetical protein
MSFIKLQVRRDTAANWTSANPTLSAGEHGFETNTGKFKIGDGSTAWSSLSYFQTGAGGGGTWGSITGTLSSQADLQSALDAKAATSHPHAASDITSGTIATARLGSGVASASTFLRGDNTWAAPSGGGGGDLLAANNLSDLASAATARTNLGLAIGTNVQAYDADLTTWATLTPSANAQSLVTAANYAAMRTLLGLVIGTDVQAYDADTVKSDTTANLTAGFSATQFSLGTITSGTVTPAFANGNEQKYTNNGAHTLAPATLTAGRATSMTVEITNGASAGAITTSGFTKVVGDSFTTTNGHEFKCFIHIGDAGSLLNVVALQ